MVKKLNKDEILLFLFSLTIFLSSFLLFLIQPIFGKMLLPFLGSSPNVWNTCMFFFQGILLLGYLYPHFSIKVLGIKNQLKYHALLLFLPLFFLPLSVPSFSNLQGQKNPVFLLILLMLSTIGVPFFVVSINAPMLQKWFSAIKHSMSKDPYFLYVSSNLGSLIALLSYPFLIEPNLNLTTQNQIWFYAYCVLVILILLISFFMSKMDLFIEESIKKTDDSSEITISTKFKWLFLSFIPSSLLLGLTTFLSTDIATVPLLWIIPLVIYLLTFIFTFATKPIFTHELMQKTAPLMVLALAFQFINAETKDIFISMLIHLFTFFILAMVCHGELAKTRPSISHLTEFYIWISLGGFMGGVFNAIVAPLIFNNVIEYPIALVLACFALPKQKQGENKLGILLDFIIPALLFSFVCFMSYFIPALKINSIVLTNLLLFGLPIIASFFFVKRPIRFGLSIASVIFSCMIFANNDEKILYTERSFFGVNKVALSKNKKLHLLIHGRTRHGAQYITGNLKDEPLAYYYKTGPIGELFNNLKSLNQESKIGVIGLGAGSLLSYGKKGQEWKIFEIDPVVGKIAEDPKFFTFISNSKSNHKIILGDGRISINNEKDSTFDLIVLDAFSSDSIPTHLLTREAVKTYLNKLKENGILAFHISNRFLNLEPVLSGVCKDLNLYGVIKYDLKISKEEQSIGKDGSIWAVLTFNKNNLKDLDKNWKELGTINSKSILWTDSFSNIFSIFRWN